MNTKQSCRPCAHKPTFTEFVQAYPCPTLSGHCQLPWHTEFLLQALGQNIGNHSPTNGTFSSLPSSPSSPQLSIYDKDPMVLCNIILTVNFVRSGLFPTGHVSLTWEHSVFVPSAEGSPEKRRACHTHHWDLLSHQTNAAEHLRVNPHPLGYRAKATATFRASIQRNPQSFYHARAAPPNSN